MSNCIEHKKANIYSPVKDLAANENGLKILCINNGIVPSPTVTQYLEDKNHSIAHTDCLIEGHEILSLNQPDIIIAESRIQHPVWNKFIDETTQLYEDLPIIVLGTKTTLEAHCHSKGTWDVISESETNHLRMDDIIDKAILKSKNKRYEKLLDQKHGDLSELEKNKYKLQETIANREFELSEAKEMLMRMQKMESLAFLAAGFSHDLQNMNSVTLSAVSSLEYSIKRNGIELPKNIITYIKLIKQANITSTDMVVKLKGLFEEKQNAFFDFNLMDILNHVVDICRCTFPSSITTWGCSDSQDVYFHGDQVSLEQAMLNLCINASHAMTIMRDDPYAGGSVKIFLRTCDVSSIKQKVKSDCINYWHLSIQDTGVGMDEDTIKKIFRPMFTTKEKGVGTGLGLLMIQHIIDSHNGVIEVESTVGEGTTFHLYLPRTEVQQPSLFE